MTVSRKFSLVLLLLAGVALVVMLDQRVAYRAADDRLSGASVSTQQAVVPANPQTSSIHTAVDAAMCVALMRPYAAIADGAWPDLALGAGLDRDWPAGTPSREVVAAVDAARNLMAVSQEYRRNGRRTVGVIEAAYLTYTRAVRASPCPDSVTTPM